MPFSFGFFARIAVVLSAIVCRDVFDAITPAPSSTVSRIDQPVCHAAAYTPPAKMTPLTTTPTAMFLIFIVSHLCIDYSTLIISTSELKYS